MQAAPGWIRIVRAAAIAILLSAGCSASQAQTQNTGKPLLLVASRSLEGPYQQTTLVAVPVEGKHIGFILNLATGVKLSALLPEHASSARIADPVYIGGPEMMEALFAVVRSDPGRPSLKLSRDLFVTGKAAAIHRIIEQAAGDARFFVGFVGWTPGELDAEIARGLWYVTEPDASLILRRDTRGMWEELVKRLGAAPRPQRGRGQIEARFDAGPR